MSKSLVGTPIQQIIYAINPRPPREARINKILTIIGSILKYWAIPEATPAIIRLLESLYNFLSSYVSLSCVSWFISFP